MNPIIGQPQIPPDDRVIAEWDSSEDPSGDLGAVVEELTIPPAQHEERLDKVLAKGLKGWSRTHLSHLIASGEVSLYPPNDRLLKPSHRVRSGEIYRITLRPLAASAAFEPEDMPLDRVHEDDHLLVLRKPAGLVVHPAPGHWSGTLLNALLHHLPGARELPRAGIVHRLDKDTSGLMVVGKTLTAMGALSQAIARREVQREYLALAHGAWHGPHFQIIRTDLGRDPRQRLRMAVLADGQGKASQTDVTCLQTNVEASWVHCRLHTGRTHQIRVHLAHLGHPLIGDLTYGGRIAAGMTRQALHAWRLRLAHPVTGEALGWTWPAPMDMVQALSQLGLGYNEAHLPVP